MATKKSTKSKVVKKTSTKKITTKKVAESKKVVSQKAKEEKLLNLKAGAKVMIVTGATSGMGFEFAREMAKEGHVVFAIGRRPALCRDARNIILQESPDANIYFMLCDLSIMAQVEILANDILKKMKTLGLSKVDVIYLNAGTITQEHKFTYEDYEYQWATNYLSGFYFVFLMLKHLSGDARVITTTTQRASTKVQLNWQDIYSRSHDSTKSIYEQSKLANLMYALELDHKYADKGIHGYCINPGNVATDIGLKETRGLKKLWYAIRKKHAISPSEAVKPVIKIATDPTLPSNVVFYSAGTPASPSKYALNKENREILWRASLKALEII